MHWLDLVHKVTNNWRFAHLLIYSLHKTEQMQTKQRHTHTLTHSQWQIHNLLMALSSLILYTRLHFNVSCVQFTRNKQTQRHIQYLQLKYTRNINSSVWSLASFDCLYCNHCHGNNVPHELWLLFSILHLYIESCDEFSRNVCIGCTVSAWYFCAKRRSIDALMHRILSHATLRPTALIKYAIINPVFTAHDKQIK